MCPHGYHHNGSMETPALGTQEEYIYFVDSKLLVPKLSVTRANYGFHCHSHVVWSFQLKPHQYNCHYILYLICDKIRTKLVNCLCDH